MELQWTTLQVLLLVGASLAQNFQSNGFQPFDQGPLSDAGFQQQGQFVQPQQQRVNPPAAQFSGPQGGQFSGPQGGQFPVGGGRAQIQRPKKPTSEGAKSLPPPLPRVVPLQVNQVQASPISNQGFQSVPQQQVRTQAPALRQQVRPVVRQPQPQPQQFQQPAQQPQVAQHFFDQPQQQQFQQPQKFAQPQQNFESEPAPAPVRRPQLEPLAAPVRRPQTQQTLLRDGSRPLTDDEELIRQQALNAKYSFSTSVTDGINDNEHIREEVRDGLNLKGLYSYSDGFFKRTVHYEADENGYRVTKEEVDSLGDGPRADPNGRAEVSSNVAGNNLQYSITAADIPFINNEHQQQQQPLRHQPQQQQPLRHQPQQQQQQQQQFSF